MEFVNSSFKSKGKSGRGGNKYNENGRNNGRPHPSAASAASSQQLNAQQYEQFVSNAIALGRRGQGPQYQILSRPNNNGLPSTMPLMQLPNPNNGILQALQAHGQPAQPTQLFPMSNNTSGSLGGLFQELTLEKNNSTSSSNSRNKEKKVKNGGGGNGYNNGATNKKIFNQIPVQKQQQQPAESHEAMTKRLNNEALLRMDPTFKGLFGNASQVAVYDYDAVTKDWTDTKMAGPLFLYSRAAIPEYGLAVLNRKGLKNLNMFFDKQSQIIPHEPYLLFRRGPDEVIKCVWFYKESEFHEALKLFRTMGVQFDQCDEPNTSAHVSTTSNNGSSSISMSVLTSSAAVPNLFDMLKQSQAKIDESSALPTFGTNSKKVFTAEELEDRMLSDLSSSDTQGPSSGTLNNGVTSLSGFGTLLGLEGGASAVTAGVGGLSLLQQLTAGGATGGVGPGSSCLPPMNGIGGIVVGRGPKNKSGDSDDSSITARLNDASRSMRTVEQLEMSIPEDKAKCDMSNELLATLGIKPIKDLPESSSEVYTPQSPFLTPTSRSISESERSQKKLTIEDLDGKLYEETDEDMVREVVETLSDLTELLLLSENVAGHAEPQLVWRKRSNLQNRPSSALIHVPAMNGVGNNTPNKHLMHQKHSIINNNSSNPGGGISPLTENQLLQAITYLLQSDPTFIGKIHDAYIKSLTQSWASNNSRLD